MTKVTSVHRIAWLVAAVLAASITGRGERLPTRVYRTGDGLVSNRISQIVRDSLGYLWFCTEQGLSRFDGNTFTNYTTDQGLPDNEINDLLETRSGEYWVATGGGLCLFNPLGSPQSERLSQGAADPMFVVYRPGKEPRESIIKTLYEDRSGSIWIGTWQGLYRLVTAAGRVLIEPVDLGPPASHSASCVVRNILEDHRGILWIATDSGLYRRRTDGRIDRLDSKNGLAGERFMGLLEDSQGRLWVGNRSNGLYEIAEQPDPGGSIVTRKCSIKDGPGCMTTITSLFQSSDGRLWVGADCGLSELVPQETGIGQVVKARLGPKDLADPRVWSLAEDSFGNLWVGSADGAIRITRGGPTTFTNADGLGAIDVCSIFESRSGRLCVYTRAPDRGFINSFDDEGHFTAIRPLLPAIAEFPSRITMQDSKGNWWMSGDEGVWRYPAARDPAELARLRPEPFSPTHPDRPGAPGATAYEDRHGDIWILNAVTRNLTRWQRSTARFQVYSEADGLPPVDRAGDNYSEDRGGALWIPFGEAEIVRYKNGSFRLFKASDGIPAGAIDQLYIDSKGQLWIASGTGLGRVEDPTEEPLRVSIYTTAQGLSSNKIGCVTEDRWGRLYVGTANGLDRLDVSTGRIKRLTTADGLANNDVRLAFRDRNGVLWFGTDTGLSRLVPEPDRPQPTPAVFINGLKVSGNRFKLSELGEIAVGRVELGPSQKDVQIDFTGLSFGPGEALRFQYKLEGADRDWNPPARQRTVNYASLSPGAYRFLVLAVDADDLQSAQPAVFEFTILRPMWQRWWFAALVAGLAGSLIYGLYRYRLAQLLEVERVRTRLAADLHDDIGSNLSQIAVWSEIARRQPSDGRADQPQGTRADASPEPLERIAATARETASAMSDIVWAINPRRDYLSDLISRMRLFAGEAFDSCDIAWQLDAPQTNLGLNAGTRREVFLIFKECVNNIIRHANCTRVEAAITIQANRLRLRIRDNGRGFDTRRASDGHGLDSLRQRARNLAGTLNVVSAREKGTTVEFEMPLSQSRWRR